MYGVFSTYLFYSFPIIFFFNLIHIVEAMIGTAVGSV